MAVADKEKQRGDNLAQRCAALERAVLAEAVELHRPHKFVDHDVLEFRLRQASEAYTLALENLGSGLESLAGSA